MTQTETFRLARKIVRKSSMQTYLTIGILADRQIKDLAYCAYAYFRWLDDKIDVGLKTTKGRNNFLDKQKKLINLAYKGIFSKTKNLEENMVIELIKSDTSTDSKLKSYITNFLSIIEFDAKRKGKVVTRRNLDWYSKTIGVAVTDCIIHFIDNKSGSMNHKDMYKAATAAHIVHTLRDMSDDIQEGFYNVPREYIVKHKLKLNKCTSPDLAEWVKDRVYTADNMFNLGIKYLYQSPPSRRRFAALLYCYRFLPLLSDIKYDKYILKPQYKRSVINTIKYLWVRK